MTAKQLERSSKKCEKNEKKERKQIKADITKGRPENARIHAENAIREKNQAVNFLRLSARVDAVAQRVQTAVTMQKVSQSMKGEFVFVEMTNFGWLADWSAREA
jgi:charged multivesicular body protein 1